MPKIEVSYSDLCKLVGRKIPEDRLEEYLLFAKCELDDKAGDTLKLDLKDTNRPDTWSVEGVAREIRLRYKKDFPNYKMNKSSVSVIVDKSVKDVRPFTVCAVVRGLKINSAVLSQLIQLQEKIAVAFGKNRKEIAIGVYDLHKIKPPITFKTVGRTEIKFVPLDFEKELTPQEILDKHPKGKEFGHLLKDAPRIPAFIDSANNVLSIPPIINSAYTGKVTEKTEDVFIECSGFNLKFLSTALNVMVAALYERGGQIETVDVLYDEKIVTPNLKEKKFIMDMDYINSVSGLDLDKKSIIDLLQRSGYRVELNKKLTLFYPSYRQDIMHARDVVEDVIISYGYNKIEPEMKKLATKGSVRKEEVFANKVSEIMVGIGLQEILSYTLTNYRDLFEKMNLPQEKTVEIENSISSNWSVFRTWLLPGLLDFFSNNMHVEYPQKIFEMGICTTINENMETKCKDTRNLAAAIINSTVSYEDISSVLDAFLRNVGIKYELNALSHSSFIEGRCANISIDKKIVGFVGEVHPKVLNNWKLDKPVVAFEINLDEMQKIKG
ncbi:MAG: phenylalanine--tRNA ligase subunit beta [Candidatus Aenigmarchaeota archaeon]|nr:phenylalanine--tRNA ligase subunit beta [Candidatus Aenigmarchaeota archaeon]